MRFDQKQKGETDNAFKARQCGEVFYLGRYRTRREVFERIAQERVWKGATETEDEHAWILKKGSAVLRILKHWNGELVWSESWHEWV